MKITNFKQDIEQGDEITLTLSNGQIIRIVEGGYGVFKLEDKTPHTEGYTSFGDITNTIFSFYPKALADKK